MPVLRRHDVVHELVPGPNILGTSSFHCNVVLHGGNIGDRHALVELSPTTSEAVVSGIGVAADVFVNGQRIGSPTKVVHGDTLAFGTLHDAFTFDITVTSSVSASTASMAAPMFSKSTQGNPVQSHVHPSFRNQTLMDAALRSLVERKLLERKRMAATREYAVGQHATQPSWGSTSTCVGQVPKAPAKPISTTVDGPTAVSDYGAAMFIGGPWHSNTDVEDEDDELPETLEKTSAPPRATVMSPYIANKPDDETVCDDDDEDELPEMVDRATSPGEMATPRPPRAPRTPSQQAAIDQRVLNYRRRILAIGLRAWRDVLRRRKRTQDAAKRQCAAKQLQACFRHYRCRRLLKNALEQRRRQRFWTPSILRLGSLWRKPRLRAALHAWVVHRLILDAHQQSIARGHEKKFLLGRAWRCWTQRAIHSMRRRRWLLRCFRLCTLAATRRVIQTWRQHQLLQTSAQMEKKLLDEQARVKSLVHAISVQTQAEANAWAEQAKETNALLRKDCEAQGELQALRAALTKDASAVSSQTETTEVVVSCAQTDFCFTTVFPSKEAQTDGPAPTTEQETQIDNETIPAPLNATPLTTITTPTGTQTDVTSTARALTTSVGVQVGPPSTPDAVLSVESQTEATTFETFALDEVQTLVQRGIDAANETLAAEKSALYSIIERLQMAAQEKDTVNAAALASAKTTAAAQETALCNRIEALELSLTNATASTALDVKLEAIDEETQRVVVPEKPRGTAETEMHEAAFNALQTKVDAADAKAAALAHQLAALTTRAVDAEAKAVFLSAELAAAVARTAVAAKSPHETVQTASEREVQAKMVAHLEAQLARAEAKIDELKRATANTTQTNRLASERFASNVDGFLERVLHDYDSRLMRCCAEVDVLQSLQDTQGAQFRAASSLVGYMQEERLAQYEMLSSLYDQVLATKSDYVRHVTTPALCLLDVSPSGQYLQTVLFQRFHRLRQLHEHMADQAGDDEKKLKYAKVVCHTPGCL